MTDSVFRYAEGSEPQEEETEEQVSQEDQGPGDVITDQAETFESQKAQASFSSRAS